MDLREIARGQGELPRVGRVLRVQGRPVHLLERGAGAPVLLLHGCGSLGQEILSACTPLPGARLIAPDRPGYGFSAPQHGREDPAAQALWLERLLDELDLPSVTVVAHSLASASALALASVAPERVERLILLAPFCRPTPHRWLPGLRLAVAPIVGRPVRGHAVPLLCRAIGRRRLARMVGADAPPAWLADLPLRHVARPLALETAAAELRKFNAGVRALEPRLRVTAPTLAIFGGRDEVARPDWHRPWLAAHVPGLVCLTLPRAGHAVHHAAPAAVRAALADRIGTRPPRAGYAGGGQRSTACGSSRRGSTDFSTTASAFS